MFQLIIALLSIALIAILAVGGVYYGGDAFSSGSTKAYANSIASQVQQIKAANTLYKIEHGGDDVTDLDDLVTGNYLKAVPSLSTDIGGVFTITTTNNNKVFITAEVKSEKVCRYFQTIGSNTATTATIPSGVLDTELATVSQMNSCVQQAADSKYFIASAI